MVVISGGSRRINHCGWSLAQTYRLEYGTNTLKNLARFGLDPRWERAMAQPEVGAKAPDFELTTDGGTSFRLSAARGSPVVLFFYAEDDTEGCTIENQEFSSLLPEFEALGVKVIGISEDTVEKHCKFRDKYGLGITLVADPEHKAIEAFGVWGPKVTFGHHLIGLIRSSFLIAPDGKIAEAWRVTRIKGHAEKVLAATRKLVTGAT